MTPLHKTICFAGKAFERKSDFSFKTIRIGATVFYGYVGITLQKESREFTVGYFKCISPRMLTIDTIYQYNLSTVTKMYSYP